ncbi:MAG: hypothetical protein WKF89_06505 [Chitinophagaceae bacterium]
MKRTLIGICCLLLLIQVQAQRKSVLLEPQTRKINQGDALPAQSNFYIQVPVSKETGIIKINVFKGGKTSDIIQRTYWARPVNFTGDFAELPVDVQLKNNSKYGFDVVIYSLLSDSERVALRGILHQNLSNYLNAALEANSKTIDFEKNADKVISDLNTLVKRGLTWYRNTQQRDFDGFSDIVKLKLQQVDKARLSNARYNVVKSTADSMASPDEIKALYANQLLNDLKQIVLNELDNYLHLDFVKLYDSFVIANRITERSQTVLPLFIGYGGVYFGGNVNALEYDSQPYAGFSFPLGRGNETHYGRTSFIMGVFISNLKDADGNKVTGPIVDRPVFAGLGFRIYDFINLNAGMVATSMEKQNLSNVKTENVQLKPFIGLNAQFNLWLGLNKK